MNKKFNILILWFLLSWVLIGSYFLGNQVLRTDFWIGYGIYLSLGAAMILVYWVTSDKIDWKFIFLIGLLVRLLLLTSYPNFSDDFSRFLWDGHLLNAGQNPYSQTPNDWSNSHSQEITHLQKTLYEDLNSPDYFSVYPPLNQAVFWFASWIGSDSILVGIIALRVVLILGEIAVFFLFLNLFQAFQIQIKKLWLYWINPFIVVEITGNLHFEGLVLLFLLLALNFQKSKKLMFSGFSWGLAIGIKLLPLLLVPAWLVFTETRTRFVFWGGAIVALVLSFGPLLIESSWLNFGQSLQLYQGKFEFNASLYYLIREVGFWVQGYNIIVDLTKILSMFTLIFMLILAWKKRPETLFGLIDLFVMMYLTYLILQPVVHPWYLIPGFGLSLFTKNKAFLAWTFTVFLSYYAYSNEFFRENPYFLWIEYGVLFLFIAHDYFLTKRKTNLIQ